MDSVAKIQYYGEPLRQRPAMIIRPYKAKEQCDKGCGRNWSRLVFHPGTGQPLRICTICKV